MDATSIVILILVGAIALEGLVLGLLIWAIGQSRDDHAARVCSLQNRVAHLERMRDLRAEVTRTKDSTHAEALDDFNDRDPLVFDDTREG